MINSTIVCMDENGRTKSVIDQDGVTIVYLPTIADVLGYMEEFHSNLFVMRSTVHKKKSKHHRWTDWTYDIIENPEIRKTLDKICNLIDNGDLKDSIRKMMKKKNTSNKEMLEFVVEATMHNMREKLREKTKTTTDLILKNDGTGNLSWVTP